MRQRKPRALRLHVQRRARERFGINLDPVVIATMIRCGSAAFVRRDSNRVTVWDLDYRGEQLRVVYDKERHLPITVLTRKMA